MFVCMLQDFWFSIQNLSQVSSIRIIASSIAIGDTDFFFRIYICIGALIAVKIPDSLLFTQNLLEAWKSS